MTINEAGLSTVHPFVRKSSSDIIAAKYGNTPYDKMKSSVPKAVSKKQGTQEKKDMREVARKLIQDLVNEDAQKDDPSDVDGRMNVGKDKPDAKTGSASDQADSMNTGKAAKSAWATANRTSDSPGGTAEDPMGDMAKGDSEEAKAAARSDAIDKAVSSKMAGNGNAAEMMLKSLGIDPATRSVKNDQKQKGANAMQVGSKTNKDTAM